MRGVKRTDDEQILKTCTNFAVYIHGAVRSRDVKLLLSMLFGFILPSGALISPQMMGFLIPSEP